MTTHRCCHALPASRTAPRTCGRCNWRAEGGETLAEHAEAAEHPLCCCCEQSLPPDRPRTCRDCQDRAGEHLHEAFEMWQELPDLLEAHASERLPGGDVLVLLGPGSRGAQGADDAEVRRLIDDNRRADTPSVAWTLITWADDWRRVRELARRSAGFDGDDPLEREATAGHDSVVREAHSYLAEHAAWAAREHWAWDSYAADLAHLHAALRSATGRHRRPGRLGLDCFQCRGPLEYRVVSEQDATPPPRRPRWWVDSKVAGPVDAVTWANRHLSNAGLEQDHATCRDCGQVYDTAALLLAQAQAFEDAQWLDDRDGTRWGTVKATASTTEVSQWTLRRWERAGLVRTSRHGGALYLHLGDVEHQQAAVEAAQWVVDEDGTRWGTVKAVAARVHRSPWTLRSWQQRGLVRSREDGGALLLHLVDTQREAQLRAPRRTEAS